MVGCRWTLLRCLFRYISLVACWVDVVNVSMKSGIARVRGSNIPSPLALRRSCAMRRVWWGRVVTPMVSEMNRAIMWLVVDVSGPVHSSRSNRVGVRPCCSGKGRHSLVGGEFFG
jgi:hypothetical protein